MTPNCKQIWISNADECSKNFKLVYWISFSIFFSARSGAKPLIFPYFRYRLRAAYHSGFPTLTSPSFTLALPRFTTDGVVTIYRNKASHMSAAYTTQGLAPLKYGRRPSLKNEPGVAYNFLKLMRVFHQQATKKSSPINITTYSRTFFYHKFYFAIKIIFLFFLEQVWILRII